MEWTGWEKLVDKGTRRGKDETSIVSRLRGRKVLSKELQGGRNELLMHFIVFPEIVNEQRNE